MEATTPEFTAEDILAQVDAMTVDQAREVLAELKGRTDLKRLCRAAPEGPVANAFRALIRKSFGGACWLEEPLDYIDPPDRPDPLAERYGPPVPSNVAEFPRKQERK